MRYDVVLIGSGFGSLTAAALLTKRGLKVCVLEQAKYPGGCASSYTRKGYRFETGATTLVGLDEGMPLRHLLNETGIEVPVQELQPSMQVYLPDGQVVTRYKNLEEWIAEAERVFGANNQRAFWEHCYNVSQRVWHASLQQRSFPFSSFKDLLLATRNVRISQLTLLPGAFRTMEDLLQRYGLLQNKLFVDFVNEQLLITAQNCLEEVNELFGATALCYTLYGNYYVPGGLINLIQPVVDFITSHTGCEIKYGQTVTEVSRSREGYKVHTNKAQFESRFVISGIPLQNTAEIWQDRKVKKSLRPYLLPSEKLNGAFTMGLVLQGQQAPAVLHHQVHVPEGLPLIGSHSIFISFSQPEDQERAPVGELVASISTHVANPQKCLLPQKAVLEEAIISALVGQGLIRREAIKMRHSATPGAWIFWTGRAFGAVGGYPQYRHIKPWQMKDARLDHKGAYVCGDTVYPGQGIVGVCLSGIIAAEKLLRDHF